MNTSKIHIIEAATTDKYALPRVALTCSMLDVLIILSTQNWTKNATINVKIKYVNSFIVPLYNLHK